MKIQMLALATLGLTVSVAVSMTAQGAEYSIRFNTLKLLLIALDKRPNRSLRAAFRSARPA